MSFSVRKKKIEESYFNPYYYHRVVKTFTEITPYLMELLYLIICFLGAFIFVCCKRMEERENWNMEFKDVTSVAHIAADFSKRAGMASRTAAQFSKEEVALGLQIPIWNFAFFVSTHGSKTVSSGHSYCRWLRFLRSKSAGMHILCRLSKKKGCNISRMS